MKREKNFGAIMLIAGSIISVPLFTYYIYASYLGIIFIAIGLWNILGLSLKAGATSFCEFSASPEKPLSHNDKKMKYLLDNSHYTSASPFERILQCNIDEGSTICFTVKNCDIKSIEMVISQYYNTTGEVKEILRREVGPEQTVSQPMVVSGASSTSGQILFEIRHSGGKGSIVNIETYVTQQ